MAYTRITNTRNGTASIRYAFEEPSHKKGMERVLMASGSNLDPQFAMQQMRDTWKAHGKDDGETVQMYRVIQSFGLDELDPNNPDDVAKANEIGQTLASELYPDKQSLIVTQADGEGGKLHNHVLVNSVSFADGKSLRGYRKEHDAVAEVTDDILVRRGMKPLDTENTRNKRTSQEKRLAASGKYVWKDDLRGRIAEGLEDPSVTSQDAFIEHMRDSHGVMVKWEENRKNITYSFDDVDGKARRSRDNKLGTDYGKESLTEQLDKNAVLQQVEQQRQQKEQESTEPSGVVFDLDAELAKVNTPKPKKRRERTAKPQETALMKEVRLEREAKEQQEHIDGLHGDALIENAHVDALFEDSEWENTQEDEKRRREQEKREKEAQEERARIEAQEQAEREEQERQRQLERERAIQRIKDATTPNKEVTAEFADKFMELASEMDGKTHKSPITGKVEEYTDFDVYRHTKMKMADEKRQEQGHQEVVQQEAVQDGPELE